MKKTMLIGLLLCSSGLYARDARVSLVVVENQSDFSYKLADGTLIKAHGRAVAKNTNLFTQTISQIGFVGGKSIMSISFVPVRVCQPQCLFGEDPEFIYGGRVFGAKERVSPCDGFAFLVEQGGKRVQHPVSLCRRTGRPSSVGVRIYNDRVDVFGVKNVFNVRVGR